MSTVRRGHTTAGTYADPRAGPARPAVGQPVRRLHPARRRATARRSSPGPSPTRPRCTASCRCCATSACRCCPSRPSTLPPRRRSPRRRPRPPQPLRRLPPRPPGARREPHHPSHRRHQRTSPLEDPRRMGGPRRRHGRTDRRPSAARWSTTSAPPAARAPRRWSCSRSASRRQPAAARSPSSPSRTASGSTTSGPPSRQPSLGRRAGRPRRRRRGRCRPVRRRPHRLRRDHPRRPGRRARRGAFAVLVDALEPARTAGVTAVIGGEAAFLNDEKPRGAEGVGLLAALVVLLVAFGTVVAALVPIVVALVAVGVGLAGILLLAGDHRRLHRRARRRGLRRARRRHRLRPVHRVPLPRQPRRGTGRRRALSSAMASSGTAVFVAGTTVVVALAALLLTGVTFLASIGIATAAHRAVRRGERAHPAARRSSRCSATASTPAGSPGRRRAPKPAEATASWRLAHRIAARPWPYLLAGTLLLLTLAAPALSLRSAGRTPPAARSAPTSAQAYDLLADGFGPGVNGPLVVVADLQDTGLGAGDLPALGAAHRGRPGDRRGRRAARSTAGGDTAVLSVAADDRAVRPRHPADPASGSERSPPTACTSPARPR